MRIIATRLEKRVRVRYPTSIRNQQKVARRRGTYQRGVTALPVGLRVKVSQDLADRLIRLCDSLRVERSMVIRDAIEQYIAIAEMEELEERTVPTTVRMRGNNARGRVAAPAPAPSGVVKLAPVRGGGNRTKVAG
jgi:predicted DNA-binding protein